MLHFNFLQYVFFTTGQHCTFIISLFNHQLPLKVIEQLTLSHDEKTSSSMLGRRRWSLEMQTCLRVKEWLKTKWSFTTWRKLWWIRWDSMMWESRICLSGSFSRVWLSWWGPLSSCSSDVCLSLRTWRTPADCSLRWLTVSRWRCWSHVWQRSGEKTSI